MWHYIQANAGSNNEDPLKEVAVMQYLATAGGHRNVLSITEAVQDETAVSNKLHTRCSN